jgi:hypothetical protein
VGDIDFLLSSFFPVALEVSWREILSHIVLFLGAFVRGRGREMAS